MDSLPFVNQCTASIKRLGKNRTNLQTIELAELYTSCIAFLCHLKTDQNTLFEAWRSQSQNEGLATCPLPTEVPAIRAILSDSALFQIFLSMLDSKIVGDIVTLDYAPAVNKVSNGGLNQTALLPGMKSKLSVPSQQFVGRKRAASISVLSAETPKKTPKLHQSPKGGGTERGKMVPDANTSLQLTSGSLLDNQNLEELETYVLAVAVFYTALQHIDHWPPALIKAYAEDCFGQRLWVDDERCISLVNNLALVTERDTPTCEILNGSNEEAQKYVKYFEDLSCVNLNDETLSTEMDTHTPAHITSKESKRNLLQNSTDAPNGNVSSSDSDSGDEECILEVTTGNAANSTDSLFKVKDSRLKKTHDGDAFSSSGEEKAVVSKTDVLSAKAESDSLHEVENSSSIGGDSFVDDGPPETLSILSSRPCSPSQVQFNKDAILLSWYQDSFALSSVRHRYVGPNKELAQSLIADALSSRLESKAKQNSRLLSALLSFTSIPQVRKLAAKHLEKWLQSPALSGLARPLFSAIVSEMKYTDPPLSEDIDAIDSILSMKLKANQFTAHVENITSIAKTIPTVAISHHIFLNLLCQELAENSTTDTSQGAVSSDPLQMLMAVHSCLTPTLAADALASALLALLTKMSKPNNSALESVDGITIDTIVRLVRSIVSVLGRNYDGRLLTTSVLSHSKRFLGSPNDGLFYDVARLLFECVILVAPSSVFLAANVTNRQQLKSQRKVGLTLQCPPSDNTHVLHEEMLDLAPVLLSIRKDVLRWCLKSYAVLTATNEDKHGSKQVMDETYVRPSYEPVGASVTAFKSILDNDNNADVVLFDSVASEKLLQTIRCLLFLVPPESSEMSSFLQHKWTGQANSANLMTTEQWHQLQLCCDYVSDVDDETIWIVIRSAERSEIPCPIALILVEWLFQSCIQGKSANLRIQDSSITWALYGLAEFTPKLCEISANDLDFDSDRYGEERFVDYDFKKKKTSNEQADIPRNCVAHLDIPRLALPGLWWRVTSLVLVMCGISPQSIGSEMWDNHPTVRSLIKMTTSGRYRFPTVDCNDEENDKLKQSEAKLREQEASIAEALFMPKCTKGPDKKERRDLLPGQTNSGARVSARQREKQAKILARQREEEARQAMEEAQRTKKLLREAQKSIMIWNPRGSARKPPKESVNLILSVAELFCLAESFRNCAHPDFLLQTIGDTSRNSIERSCDWLIPIISTHSGTINRLPASASCFLLLRAYGTDSNQNSQLLELSAPLLNHVTDCIAGKFGEAGARRAVDLLFVDLADPSPDRRRCARRVLQDAFGKMSFEEVVESDEFSWLVSLLRVKHAAAVIPSAAKHLSHALAYERGRVLRAFVLALNRFVVFLLKDNIDQPLNFESILYNLLSERPHVCSSVMDRYPDLRNLALEVVHKAFLSCVGKTHGNDVHSGVKMTVPIVLGTAEENGSHKERTVDIVIPYSLLKAAVILISTWQGNDADDKIGFGVGVGDALYWNSSLEPEKINSTLVDFLIASPNDFDRFVNNGGLYGAASAAYVSNGKRAVLVDLWVMLAKARCDSIARRAAFSAPDVFLPRLLLCCGLPRSSLITMIDRLGKLGDESLDDNKAFSQLLFPSTTAERGMSHFSKRSLTVRKLLGRVTAYIDLYKGVIDVNFDNPMDHFKTSSFVTWLIEECRANEEKSKKTHSKRSGSVHFEGRQKLIKLESFSDSASPGSVVSTVLKDHKEALSSIDAVVQAAGGGDIAKIVALSSHSGTTTGRDVAFDIGSCDFFQVLCKDHDYAALEVALKAIYNDFLLESDQCGKASRARADDRSALLMSTQLQTVAQNFFTVFIGLAEKPAVCTRIFLKWIPLLTQSSAESFWRLLFQNASEESADIIKLLLARCFGVWSERCIYDCQTWILTTTTTDEQQKYYSLPMMLRFLILSSGQQPAHGVSCFGRPQFAMFAAVDSHNRAAAGIAIALDCAKVWYDLSLTKGQEESAMTIATEGPSLLNPGDLRSVLPDWLEFFLLLGKCGKKQLDLLTNSLTDRLPNEGWEGKVLPITLLRLYTCFPSIMSLSDARVRGVLVESARTHAASFLDWRSPLDEQIKDTMMNLVYDPQQRQQQVIADLSKRQPLLVVRHLIFLVDALNEDGCVLGRHGSEIRGRVVGTGKAGVAIAQTKKGVVKVTVRHWGYCFTESLWLSILDVVGSLPGEVSFSCGWRMGLRELFELNIKVIIVQLQTGEFSNTLRIREKLARLISSLRMSNETIYLAWIDARVRGLEGYGSVSSLLDICELNLKNDKENNGFAIENNL